MGNQMVVPVQRPLTDAIKTEMALFGSTGKRDSALATAFILCI